MADSVAGSAGTATPPLVIGGTFPDTPNNSPVSYSGNGYVYIEHGATITIRCDDKATVTIGSLTLSAEATYPGGTATASGTYNGPTYDETTGPVAYSWTLHSYGVKVFLEVSGTGAVVTTNLKPPGGKPADGETRERVIQTTPAVTKTVRKCISFDTKNAVVTDANKNGGNSTVVVQHRWEEEVTTITPEIKTLQKEVYNAILDEWIAEGAPYQDPDQASIAAKYPETITNPYSSLETYRHWFGMNTGKRRAYRQAVPCGCNSPSNPCSHTIEFWQAAFAVAGGGGSGTNVHVTPGGSGGGSGNDPDPPQEDNPGNPNPNPGDPNTGNPFYATPQTQYKPTPNQETVTVSFTGDDPIPIGVAASNCTATLDGEITVPAGVKAADAIYWNALNETAAAYVFEPPQDGEEPTPGEPTSPPGGSISPSPYYFWWEENDIVVESDGAAYTNRILTNLPGEIEYRVNGGDWLTWSAADGVLTYTVPANAGPSRNAIFWAVHVESGRRAAFMVLQRGAEGETPPKDFLKWQRGSLTLRADDAGTYTNRVQTNLTGAVGYSVVKSVEGDWLTWSTAGGVLTYAVSANEASDRTAVFTVRHAASGLEAVFVLRQLAPDREPPTPPPFLNWQSGSLTLRADEAGTYTNRILTNLTEGTEVLATAADWLTWSAADGVLTYTVPANTGKDVRTATFTVRHAASGLEDIFALTQAGAEITPYLFFPKTEFSVPANPPLLEFANPIQSNTDGDWTTTTQPRDAARWILFSPAGFSLLSPNPFPHPRIATFAVRHAASGLEASYTVTQAGTEPFLELAATHARVIQAAGAFSLAFYTNAEIEDISAESSADWLEAEISGTALVIRYATNVGLEPREARVVIRDTIFGLEAEFTLTQGAQSAFPCTLYIGGDPADGRVRPSEGLPVFF